MGLLSTGQATLNRVLKADAGQAVTYSRKVHATTYTVSLTARPAAGTAAVAAESGLAVVSAERDWLVEAADLVLNGAATTPHKGDRITDADGTAWELTPVVAGEPAWRFSDPQTRTLYRVHTKRVSA